MQTATESIDAHSVQERLERLKSGVSSTTAAEAALMKTKAERLSALRREARKFAEADAQKLEIRIHALTEDFKEQTARAHVAMELRSARIQQAYHSSKASLARRIQEEKDRRIGKVQGAIMRNRQTRQQELDQAAASHAAFVEQLTADRAVRRDLRKRVLSSLRTFRPLVDGWFDGRRGKFPAVEVPESPEKTRSALLETLDEAQATADAAGRLPVVKFFRFIPLWILTVVIAVMHLWYGLRAGGGGLRAVFPSFLIAEGMLLVLWLVAFISGLGVIRQAAVSLARARTLEAAADRQSAARLAALKAEIKGEQVEEGRNLSETFRESDDEWRARMAEGQRRLDAQFARMPARLERLHQRRLAAITSAHEQAISVARGEADVRLRAFEAEQNVVKSSINAETEESLGALAGAWRNDVLPTMEGLVSLEETSRARFPAWTPEVCASWEAPDEAPQAVRIGKIEVDAAKLTGGLPGDPRFSSPAGGHLAAPFALAFPDQGSILIESDGSDEGASTRTLSAIALRLLASHPPGRASFVFIDPVGLGKDFAGLMHLADYEETLINNRIWTQSTHIEERLAEVNDHIEKVIQMYLRDEFANITEYNKQAGTIAEKYRFVVIAGFPAAFSDTAMKRLRSIASSGARCGVHLLVQRDLRQPAPDPALEDELRRTCHRIVFKNGVFHLAGAPAGADVIVFDPPPSLQDSITLVHRIGKSSVDSNRVQVPFSQIAPSEDEFWKTDTSDELRVPVGRTGAKKLQMLAIGKGTRQHVLVAGKTGSGKSTLFHVIITNLAQWCSPEQVEFYLVDFKKGVEFKCYAAKHLPHARVVAIESDREFALSVLQRVDAELKRRGELFRRAGAQDVPGYKRSAGAEPMPRTLLLIDEFQEFFTEDDAVAQEASLLLDRVVRQGRAFGIHVILGSQTLGGAYTLARATLGQMVIRIALQCNETDAHLIMDDDNPAPRLLTRPGEGIYNDQAGALAANSPFQIVWLPEDERDAVLDKVAARAACWRENAAAADHFRRQCARRCARQWRARRLAPLASRHPSAGGPRLAWRAEFDQRPHRGLVPAPEWQPFVSRWPGGRAFALAAGDRHGFHLRAVSAGSGRIRRARSPRLRTRGRRPCSINSPRSCQTASASAARRKSPDLMAGLGAELTARAPTSGRDAPEVFLLVHDLQRFKALRPEDDFKFSMDDDEPPPPAHPRSSLTC